MRVCQVCGDESDPLLACHKDGRTILRCDDCHAKTGCHDNHGDCETVVWAEDDDEDLEDWDDEDGDRVDHAKETNICSPVLRISKQ